MTERQTASGITLVEGVIDAVTARLQAALPAKLYTLYTEYSDAIDLVAPVAYYSPMTDTPSPLNINYPSVLVLGASVRNNPNTEGMRAFGGGTDMALSYAVYVFPLCKGDTEANLQKMLYRYVVGIVEVLTSPGVLDDGRYECFFASADYQNPAVSSEDDLIRDAPIEFLVTSVESY